MASCTYSTANVSLPDHSEHKIEVPDEWTCPHEAAEEAEQCIFHLSDDEREEMEITDDEVRQAVYDLATASTDGVELLGANLPGLDLRDIIITGESGDVFDIRYANVEGELNLDDAIIEIPFKGEGAEFGGGLELENTVFDDRMHIYGARIKSTVEGTGVQFRDQATFSRVLSTYSIRLRDSTVFEKKATFSNLEIKGSQGKLDLRRSIAKAPLYCRKVDIPGLDCSDAIFEGPVSFSGASIGGDADFSRAHFHALAMFGDGRKQLRENTEIEGDADFTSVLAEQTLSFDSVQFKGDLDFTRGSFSRGVKLLLVTLYSDVIFDEADFEHSLVFKPQYTDSEDGSRFLVKAHETDLSAGILAQPGQDSSDPIRFEFVDATIGDVSFYSTDVEGKPFIQDNYSYRPAPLNRVKFVRTRFEGFDFTSYRTALEGDWTLHQFGDSDLDNESPELTPKDLELTYMYGKRGANEIGDNLAASKLFEKEMSYRTQRYNPGNGDTGFGDWWKYVELKLWGIVDYSESPLRVFGLGIGIGIVFAVLYFALSVIGVSSGIYPDVPLNLGTLIFSFESLITLVHSPGATVESTVVRAVSVFEGFLGAFVVALFVFALTRAVHR